jgi:NAD(P) transhydrogenase subunit beta
LLLLLLLTGLSILLGILVAIRIGGADMPVLISFLNATSGFAAAFCGVILSSPLLVACGAVVAASGSILTQVMCQAMNRHLWQVFLGFQARTVPVAVPPTTSTAPAATPKPEPEPAPPTKPTQSDAHAQAANALRSAHKVIFVPGYGMAVAQAQAEVVELAGWLQRRGVEVSFAIHPVAGRMPGHMNVLLAEADVDYDLLKEMDQVNPEFSGSDVALVLGACDVVNPAANTVPDTPISGMPVLRVNEAAHVVICNLDERPGYSGVPNPLYQDAKTLLLLGDAKVSLRQLITTLETASKNSVRSQPAAKSGFPPSVLFCRTPRRGETAGSWPTNGLSLQEGSRGKATPESDRSA